MPPDNYSKKMFPPTKEELLESYRWGQIFQHETRISIQMYLRMNGRLSFSQIVNLVNKSRSTVHHHLQIMIKGGIVNEVIDTESRGQFDPKFYELTKHPYPAYSFHNIHELPEENQKDAFLMTTKLHQVSLFYLNQVENLFKHYLDSITEQLLTNKNLDPKDLKKIWTDSLIPSKKEMLEIPFNEIHYFAAQVSESVYTKYREELEIFNEKLFDLIKEEQKTHQNISKPHFIFNIAAPLGRPYRVDKDSE
jgi:DNA-binding transcriptional ArsR family regulator